MTFAVIFALCALGALLCAWVTGAFQTLAWLWVIPTGFVGFLLVISASIILLINIMNRMVDVERPQEKDNRFYRFVIHRAIDLLIPLLRIRIRTQGMEKAPDPKSGRIFLVCNHINDIDPAVLLRCFPKHQLAFISKRENLAKPYIGPFMHKILCQCVNRENDREALKTILNCIRLLKEDKASIGVFPEGYVSADKKLHPFRSGVFKIAQKANVPIVVCTVRNTQYAIANGKKGKPTDIHMHLVGVLYPEDIQGMTAIDIGHLVHSMMAQDLGPDLVLQEEN